SAGDTGRTRMLAPRSAPAMRSMTESTPTRRSVSIGKRDTPGLPRFYGRGMTDRITHGHGDRPVGVLARRVPALQGTAAASAGRAGAPARPSRLRGRRAHDRGGARALPRRRRRAATADQPRRPRRRGEPGGDARAGALRDRAGDRAGPARGAALRGA